MGLVNEDLRDEVGKPRPRRRRDVTGLILAGLGVIAPAVYVLAALSVVTVVQRIVHVRSALTRGAAAL